MSEWLRREKWVGFYEGSYAPHLKSDGTDAAEGTEPSEKLPWRSHAPASQLLAFLDTSVLSLSKMRALELGCGTGENLVALAQVFDFVCGVDIVQEAVKISEAALKQALIPASTAQVICADIFQLSPDVRLVDQGSWQFDFVFDCQCFHCLYQVDGRAAAHVIAKLLAPGGYLLMLTGNSEEEAARGPVQLSREEVLHAFDGTGLICKELSSTRFDWTDTYRRQDFKDPPLAWCSLWMKPELG